MKKEPVIRIKTTTQCNKCFSQPTLHPLICLNHLPEEDAPALMCPEFFSVLLKETPDCTGSGWKDCDFREGILTFSIPGNPLNLGHEHEKRGWLLGFHPSLLIHTPLNNHLNDYTFFHYRPNEALHLSSREMGIIRMCLDGIADELHWSIDEYSQTILACRLELLLNYATRFYKRQFITRQEVNRNIIEQTEELSRHYFLTGQAQLKGLPTPGYFARMQGLSTAYLEDLLRHETGKDTVEYIRLKQFDLAREQLRRTEKSITCIATELGYSSPQYFRCLFKRMTGHTPEQYKHLKQLPS